MSSMYFQKPENALKRAHELLALAKGSNEVVTRRHKNSALEILHNILVSKKHKTWAITHEHIMLLYIDICVDLQLGRIVKDGLHQYRNLTMQQNPNSLEVVINHLVKRSEERIALANIKSNKLALAAASNIVDLEAAQTPEMIMLSTTSADTQSERTNREVVVPWLRFLWEVYRTILDILRCNSRMAILYHEIALKCFQFCVEYKRKIEFRRICEILRTHLQTVIKYGTPAAMAAAGSNARPLRGWDGFTVDSIELFLQLRFDQLQVGTELELWNEAFRTIEDIHSIMAITQKPPKASLMATYYERLSQIFWVSKNYLFHAYAWHKFYTISRNQNTKLTKEQLRTMASAVLLAALSIPIIESKETSAESLEHSFQREKIEKMADLMGASSSPKRSELLSLLVEQGIIEDVNPELQRLYHHLEVGFQPLLVVPLVKPALEYLRGNATLSSYVPLLENLLIQRLISQLTSVYSSVTIDYLKKLIEGLDVSFYDVEQLIVRSVDKGKLHVKIDHRKGCLRFGEMSLESNRHMSEQLSLLGRRLSTCVKKFNRSGLMSAESAFDQSKAELFKKTEQGLSQENARMLHRKVIIEKRKEELEQLQQEKILIEKRRRENQERLRREMEKARMEQEAQRREKERRQRVKDEIALKETKSILVRLGKDLDQLEVEDLGKVDCAKMVREAQEKAAKAKEDAVKKLRDQEKRLDYIVRAVRENEQPILASQYTEDKKAHLEAFDKKHAAFLLSHKEEYDFALKEKLRLVHVVPFRGDFATAHQGRRKELYEERLAEHQTRLLAERLRSKLDRAKERFEAEQTRLRLEEEEQLRLEEEAEEKRMEELKRVEREREEEALRIRREEEMQQEAERAVREEQREREAKAKLAAAAAAAASNTSATTTSSSRASALLDDRNRSFGLGGSSVRANANANANAMWGRGERNLPYGEGVEGEEEGSEANSWTDVPKREFNRNNAFMASRGGGRGGGGGGGGREDQKWERNQNSNSNYGSSNVRAREGFSHSSTTADSHSSRMNYDMNSNSHGSMPWSSSSSSNASFSSSSRGGRGGGSSSSYRMEREDASTAPPTSWRQGGKSEGYEYNANSANGYKSRPYAGTGAGAGTEEGEGKERHYREKDVERSRTNPRRSDLPSTSGASAPEGRWR